LQKPLSYTLMDKVYRREGVSTPFAYNDGEDAEQYLLHLFERSTDLGTGSDELVKGIRDWSSLYHLSHQRADLLRPFSAFLQNKRVLEIGSGCGAITRFLGEHSASVLALEGSPRRASITAERCRDLSNVQVVQDNFNDFDWDGTFDVITLIGVLEYANLYMEGPNAPGLLLQRLKKFMAPGAQVILAIENKLGTKYWAGAPEDHTGRAYDGIEDRYTAKTPVTYGKEELKDLLGSAGFAQTEFYYPFPDYKFPTVVLKDEYLQAEGFNLENLLMPNADYFQDKPYHTSFSVPLALRQLIRNKLAGDLANSFLVTASLDVLPRMVPEGTLGYSYSSQRKRSYAKENRFVRQYDGQISVQRSRIFPDAVAAPHPWIKHHVEGESYLQGNIHFIRFMEIMATPEWSLEDLVKWAKPYVMLLKGLCLDEPGPLRLEGRYLDAVPFNVLTDKHKLYLFDLEWEVSESIPLQYVLARGFFHCLGRIQSMQSPRNGTPSTRFALVEALVKRLIPEAVNVIDDFVERESRYFEGIGAQDQSIPMDFPLPVGKHHPDRDFALKEDLIETLRAENERFKEITEWYKRTYETRSLAGILLTRIFARNR
jgi:2-polyprenyl-3-methyl-5-hydroxy-6-metoxy-1,4-benzoquinol methylase